MTNLRKRLRSSEGKDRARVSGTGLSQLLLLQQDLPCRITPGAWGKAKGCSQDPRKGQVG